MKRLDIPQGEREWFEARKGIPTASEFYKIVTPKTGALSAQATGYIAELIDEIVHPDTEEMFRSYWMERGRIMEEEAANWYEFRYDVPLEKIGIILNHGAGYSPDRAIGLKGAVEFKCPKPTTHVKWMLNGGPLDDHRPQVHGGLIIGELEWIDLVSYCPGYKTIVVRVTPNDYTVKVEKALDSFLMQYEEAKVKVLQ